MRPAASPLPPMEGDDAVRRAAPDRTDGVDRTRGAPAPPAARDGRDRQRALMALPPDLRSWASASLRMSAVAPGAGPQQARAYCGAAHHVAWTLDAGEPPEQVAVPVGDHTEPYRLVRDPLTGEPARDLRGALVFVPARRADD